MTYPFGHPEVHYEAVKGALRSSNVLHVENVIKVTKLVAVQFPYGDRKDLERLIAEELFHQRVDPAFVADWAALNVWLGGLP